MNRNAMGVAFAALCYLAVRDGLFTKAPAAERAASGGPGFPSLGAMFSSSNPTVAPAKGGVTITLLNADLSDAAPATTGKAANPSIREVHYSFCKS